eukprot:2718925-Heterocapsa_arctica.AAC.1
MELVTCDHIISKSMEGLTCDKDALVIKDLFSNLKHFCPVKVNRYRTRWLHFSSFKGLTILRLCIPTTPARLSKLVKS